jgi:hypothetical protein
VQAGVWRSQSWAIEMIGMTVLLEHQERIEPLN